ncbi:MAG: hypothetical protein HYY68_04320 [Thaumarchaeota archaeon]|nr:hypothetical protein [Nitrososphaerota archaeon]MBI3022937.1 hypothetical protein [Nitrososphaerota archaeon]
MPAKKQRRRLIGACFVEVAGLLELGRLSCALERAPFPIFASAVGKRQRLAVQTDLFMGKPIFYCVEVDKATEFLAYKSAGENEEAQLVDSAQNPTFIYAPLIHVLKLPKVLDERKNVGEKYLAAEVQNLTSLVKIASYKMLYEEPPLPLYAFKNGSQSTLGCFARLDDYEEASLFFYTRMKSEPEAGFVRYSPTRITETAFSKRTDEHGFIYIKIIRLRQKHPLVEF